jgi:hypothetical protein
MREAPISQGALSNKALPVTQAARGAYFGALFQKAS